MNLQLKKLPDLRNIEYSPKFNVNPREPYSLMDTGVEVDRAGIIIKTFCEQDVAFLSQILDLPDEKDEEGVPFKVVWEGRNVEISQVGGITFVLRTQSKTDIEQLERMLPPDKAADFVAYWSQGVEIEVNKQMKRLRNITLKPAPAPVPARIKLKGEPQTEQDPLDTERTLKAKINAMKQAALKTRLIELGQADYLQNLPHNTSNETLKEKLLELELEALAAKASE